MRSLSSWLAAVTTAAPVTTGPSVSDIDPTTGHGPEWGKAAPIGLLVIVLLVVACWFLARSFSKQVKRVPASFDPVVQTPVADPPTGTSAASAAAVATAPAPPRPAAKARSGKRPPGRRAH